MRYFKINNTLVSENHVREIRQHQDQIDFDCMDNKTLAIRYENAARFLEIIMREIEHGTKVIDIDLLRGR
jgi:hypothetical protein